MGESTPYYDQLLATKFFVPASSHALIPRPRLTALLDEGLRRKLTLLSAPAGFGKTTLLSDWLRSRPPEGPPVAWVSLDEDDNDPVRFWNYVFTALDSCQPGLCSQLLAFLHTQQTPPLQSVLTALINTSLKRAEPLLLVLDDYHVITEQVVHDSLGYLLEHLPSHLHIYLSTRYDPPLPLSRLRVRDQVLEIRTDQLRGTPQEGAAFLREVMGIELTGSVLQGIMAHTEGWLAGLQLLGLSLQGRRDPNAVLNELRGSQRYTLDYLTEEVLEQQSVDVQAFLLRTSLLERLSAPLCDALLEQAGSQQMLEELERANLFIVALDAERRWYRYHALFAEALRYRLEQMHPEEVSGLYLRASEWYAGQGNIDEAVQYALQAQVWQKAADLIEQIPYALSWGISDHARLRRSLEALPVEIRRSRCRLCLAYAKTLFMVAPYPVIEDWLQNAETALWSTFNDRDGTDVISASEKDEQENLLGMIAAYRAIIAGYHRGDGQATLAFCQEALDHLPNWNVSALAEVAYAQALAHHSFGEIVAAIQSMKEALALAHSSGEISTPLVYLGRTAYSLIVAGKLHEAAQVAELAARLGTAPGGLMHAMLCWTSIFHAVVLWQWNRLDEALDLALQAVQLSEQTETIVSLYLGYTLLMRVYLGRGDREAARSAFHQAEQAMAKTYSSYRRNVYIIDDWVQFWLVCGEIERAVAWAEELMHSDRAATAYLREREDVARARILLASKQHAQALELLEPLLVTAQKQERWSHVIEMLLLQALAYQLADEEPQALSALVQAVGLGEPEGYIRSFVEEGSSMAALLVRLREQQLKQGPTPYLNTILAAFPPEERLHEGHLERVNWSIRHIPSQPLDAPLSERELDVLRLLARGASNQEIAEELVVALNTVKHHVGNILSKLGASNRTQAVAQARSLGLLPDES